MPDDDESGVVLSAALNGSTIELSVKGLMGVELVWFGSVRVQVFAP